MGSGTHRASSKAAHAIERLVTQERDNRRFLEQIARHEPLPNILKDLIDIFQRQRPQLRGCFTLIREGQVFYAVAPTLGGEFAAAAEDVAARQLARLADRPLDPLSAAPDSPTVTDMSADDTWAPHRPLLARHGLRSCWSGQLVSEGELLGNFAVYGPHTAGPTRDDLDLIAAITDKAAIAIEHQELIERLAFQSLHDPLTGLPNRTLLEDRLQHTIARARRDKKQIALFLVNIDRFKVINDTLGHGSGDELLRQVAQRLQACVRGSDTVARVSADEFAIVATELRDRDAASAVAQKLLQLLEAPATVAGRELVTTSSIGAAIFPEDGDNTVSLHQSADRALCQSKALGRNRYSFFNATMGQAPIERLELDLQAQLRRAVENNELYLNYQPQVDGKGTVVGVEALLRWENPSLGRVSPAQFIPVAEQTGLIIPIGEWVLREACRQAQAWHARPENPSLRMAVNVSALQFAQPGFLRIVQEVLAQTGLEPRWLELELTESLLMQNTQDAAAKLSALRQLGVAAAIDDFGTGYSSLAYLRRLPIDTLKIDRSFVADIIPGNGDDSATAVVRAILSMARSLNLQVVAEGVETPDQRDFLISAGCQLMQGYLFGRPQTAAEITRVLDNLRRPATLALSA